MQVQMKPETIARRAAKRISDTADRKANLLARLTEKAAQAGQDSIWGEMLCEWVTQMRNLAGSTGAGRHEYREGPFTICRMGDEQWLATQPALVNSTDKTFARLRDARAWCRSVIGGPHNAE